MQRALREFLRDLFAGEPVALMFVVVVLLWGAKIMRDKRRLDAERKDRWRKDRWRKNRSKPL